MTRMVSGKVLRTWLPLVVLAFAVAAFVFSLIAYSIAAPNASWLSRIYAALDMFTGSYLPVGGQTATPSGLLGVAGICALLVTFLAALTALYELLSTRARQWFRARNAGSGLIVVGAGEAAASLLRTARNPTSKDLLLITDEEGGPASVTAAETIPKIVADLAAFATTPSLLGLTQRTKRVAVATADDGLNLMIADALARQPRSTRKVMALVTDPRLADERRPGVIDGKLPDRFGISCPTENIAEEVCHQIDLRLLSNHQMDQAEEVAIYLNLDESDLAHTVALWVERHSWSRGCMLSELSQRPLPRWKPVDLRRGYVPIDPAIQKFPRVHVVAWADQGVSATKALRSFRHEKAGPNAEGAYHIAVTTRQLIGENMVKNSQITVVDPNIAKWDHSLFFDDIEDQWGRAFHQAYNTIYGTSIEWSQIRHTREGQSSRVAALHMLFVLQQHGYQLVKTVDGAVPVNPDFTDDQALAMAEMEHEDWLVRTYEKDDGTSAPVAAGRGLEGIHWADLSDEDKSMNLRLIRHTYPGMAALFGYQIQKSQPA